MRSIPNFKERKLYHQIHPIKRGADIGSAIAFLFLLWRHRIVLALVVGFIPPIIVSCVMMIWPTQCGERQEFSVRQVCLAIHDSDDRSRSTLTLVPMAWGAWTHHIWLIELGFVLLLVAWSNGLIWPHRKKAATGSSEETSIVSFGPRFVRKMP